MKEDAMLYCLIQLILLNYGASTETQLFCTAPSAVVGETARLTCHFGFDVTAMSPRPTLKVKRHDHDDANYQRDTVLDCDWNDADRLRCMTLKDGFEFDYRVSDQLTLLIPNVTHEYSGKYTCQLLPSDFGSPRPCYLTVKNTTTSSKNETLEAKEGGLGLPLTIAIPVIVVVLPLAVAILVYMFWRRHGDNGSKSKKDREKELSDIEDQTNAKSTVKIPLLPISPADGERQEPPAENDDDSGYVRLANQDQDPERNVFLSPKLPTQAGSDNEQGEDEISDEDEDDGIEEVDIPGPLPVRTPRTGTIQEKMKEIAEEAIEHGVEPLRFVMAKRESAQIGQQNGVERCFIVVGKTGNGRSSVGNTLLGKDEFQTGCGMSSTTTEPKAATSKQPNIKVVDTPDISDVDFTNKQRKEQLSKWKRLAAPGPHAILLTVRCDVRYTAEEYEIYKQLKTLWGDSASFCKLLIVAFTFGDRQDTNIEEELESSVPYELKNVLKDANGRYVVFNNKTGPGENVKTVNKLLYIVNKLSKTSSATGPRSRP